MSDLPTRGATEWQWLRVKGLLSPTIEPIIEAYVDGELLSRAEWEATIEDEPFTQEITVAGHSKRHGGHFMLTGYSNFGWPKWATYGTAFKLIPVDAAVGEETP